MVEIIPRKTRRPRRREELPYPTLPASHSKNQLDVLFSARVSPEVKSLFDAWIKASGLTTKQAAEFALQLLMERYPDGHKLAPK